MKTIIKSIIALILCSFILSNCNKYVDGPKVSFRSKKARLVGDWKVEKYTENGVSKSFNSDYVLHIKKGGSYNIVAGSYSDEGTYEVGEDGDDIIFTSTAPNTIKQSYRILRLKNKEMWWKQTQPNGDVFQTNMKQ